MLRSPIRFPFVAACCLLAGCSTVRVGETLPAPSDDIVGPSPPLEEAWSYDAEAAFGPMPVILRGDVLLFGTRQGELQALRVGEDVRSMGRVELGEAIEGRLATDGRVAFVPVATGSKGVRAYDLRRGRTLWSGRYGPHLAGLVLDEEADVLVAASHDGVLRGLDPTTGDERWAFTPDAVFGTTIGGRSYRSAPALMPGGRVAAVDDEGTVAAFDIDSGEMVWSLELNAPVLADLSADAAGLLVSTTEGEVVAVGWEGAERWRYAAGPTVRMTTAASHEDLVVFGGTDGLLRALNSEAGAERWTFRVDGALAAPPAIGMVPGDAVPIVYVGGMDKRVLGIGADSGEVVWQAEVDGRVKTAPVVVPGGVVFFREPSEVVMFRSSDNVADQTQE